jgi:uncharacterized protein YrrD
MEKVPVTAFDLNIGAEVVCQDGKCGKLRKIVIDPDSRQVTDLIVEKGWLLKEDRVIPYDLVNNATEEEIQLSIRSDQLSDFQAYQEVSFQVPDQEDWEDSVYQQGQVVTWSRMPNAYGLQVSRPLVPILEFKVDDGVPDQEALVKRGTPVLIDSEEIGQVDHLLVDSETGEMDYLVVDQGLLQRAVIIPSDYLKQISESGVSLDVEEKELAGLPRYHPREENALLAELRDRLQEEGVEVDSLQAAVEGGVVKLSGNVPGVSEKRRAEAASRSVEGVVSFENALDTDTAVTARVTAALADDPRTELSDIDVAAERGLVTLAGRVDRDQIRKTAQEIAEDQQGVIKVINHLVVEPDQESQSLAGRDLDVAIGRQPPR